MHFQFSPFLPTHAMFGKASCVVLGAITPAQPAFPMTSRPWAHLSAAWVKLLVTGNKVKQRQGKTRAVHGSRCHLENHCRATSTSMMCTTAQRLNQMLLCVYGIKSALPLQLTGEEFKIAEWGVEELAPPAGLLPLPRWVRGPLLVPYRPGTPTYKL
jgi:hypothetical protein